MDDLVSKGLKPIKKLVEIAIDGMGQLVSARTLAHEYLSDRRFVDDHARVNSLIRWEASKNFGSGFVAGLGGLIMLPASIPGALVVSWIIQARMSAAIAIIYGNDIEDDRVRTLVFLSIIGDSVKEFLKQAGITLGSKLTEQIIKKIPGRILIEINKKAGFRLITKAGQKGVFNLIKAVPIAGGIAGGSIDAASCYSVGKAAKCLFAA